MSPINHSSRRERQQYGPASAEGSLIRQAPRVAGCVLGCFGLIWSLFTLGFDGFVVWSMVGQWRTTTYPTVEGRMIESRVESQRSIGNNNRGYRHSYKPILRYEYVVEGKRYESNRYALVEMSTSDGEYAHDIVNAHPLDSTVQVHYNPDDPSLSVLRPGLTAGDWFMPIFILPFNAIMLAILWAALALARADQFMRDCGVQLIAQGPLIRIRRLLPPAWLVGLACAGAAAFIMIFILAFGFGFSPPPAMMLFTLCFLIAAAIIGGLKAARSETRRAEIILDEVGRRISFHHGWGRSSNARVEKMLRKSPRRQTTDEPADISAQAPAHPLDDPLSHAAHALELPYSRIRSITLQRFSGPRKPAAAILHIAYTDDSHTPRTHKLWGWARYDQAQAFAQWLTQKLGLPTELAPAPPFDQNTPQ